MNRLTKIVCILVAGLVGWMCAEVSFAQSVLNFPRLVVSGDRFTGIAITNPTNRPTNIRITVYDDQGVPQPLPVGKADRFSIAPGSQVARLDSELFGFDPGFSGWVQIRSEENTNLRGFYLVGDSQLTLMDGGDPPLPLTNLIFPFIQVSPTSRTEITLVNPNDAPADVSMRLVRADGSPAALGSSNLILGPRQVYRRDLSEAFTFADFSRVTYLQIGSSLPVLGASLIENRARPSLAMLNAQSGNSANRTLYFPHVVLGGDFFNLVGIVNLTSTAQTVSISFYKNDGTFFETGSVPNPRLVTIEPNGSFQKTLTEIFSLASNPDSIQTGWLKVEGLAGAITGFVTYGTLGTPTMASVPVQPRPLTRMIFSHIAQSDVGFFTGLAFLNPNSQEVSLTLSVIGANGLVRGEKIIRLAPFGKIARMLGEFISEVGNQSGGSIVLMSDQPIFALELFGTVTLSVLANVPPQEILGNYVPMIPGKFLLGGKIIRQQTNEPVPNVDVQIAGSVPSSTVTTDERGEYVFVNLPAGNYTIQPQRLNFDFTPLAPSITLQSASRLDVDFTANELVGVTIKSISPPSGFVGIPITIEGTGFSRVASENIVRFEGITPPATVLTNPAPTDTKITVVVPTGARTGRVTVTVAASTSNSVVFNVVPPEPIEVSPTPGTPTSIAISGLGDIAVVGNSTDGTVSLLDLSKRGELIGTLNFAEKSGGKPVGSVATDDDGRGGGTVPTDDGIGFFRLEQVAAKLMAQKVARLKSEEAKSKGRDSATDALRAKIENTPFALPTVQYLKLPLGSGPTSLAFEPFGRFAISSNRGSDSIGFIDFDTGEATFKGILALPRGSQPVAAAIAPNGEKALVANAGNNTVTVLKFGENKTAFLVAGLSPRIVNTIALPASPNAVALNLAASIGVTANQNNTASVFTMGAEGQVLSLTTLALPRTFAPTSFATSVAIAPNGSYAFVTTRDDAGNSHISTIGLRGAAEVKEIIPLPVGRGAQAIAIGPDSATTLVANPISKSLSIFEPPRGDVDISILSLSRARPLSTLSLFGRGFSEHPSNNVVLFHGRNGQALAAPVLATPPPSSAQLTVEVPLGAETGPVTVAVDGKGSNEKFFTVFPESTINAVPSITSIVPTSAPRNFSLIGAINGQNFASNAILEVDIGFGPMRLDVAFTGAAASVTSSTRIDFFIPADALTGVSSVLQFNVFNPPPGGGRSNTIILQLRQR